MIYILILHLFDFLYWPWLITLVRILIIGFLAVFSIRNLKRLNVNEIRPFASIALILMLQFIRHIISIPIPIIWLIIDIILLIICLVSSIREARIKGLFNWIYLVVIGLVVSYLIEVAFSHILISIILFFIIGFFYKNN